MLFTQDILRPFEAQAFKRPMTYRRILTRDVFVANSPEHVRDAFVTQHEAFQRKTPQMRSALAPLVGDGLFVSDGDLWKKRRLAIAPIVHTRHMRSFYPIMLEAALEWREHWAKEVDSGPVDILNEMGLLTAEIIARSVFGQRVGRKYTNDIVTNFARYQKYVGQTAIADMVHLPNWVPRFQRPEVGKSAGRIHTIIDQIMDEIIRDREADAASGITSEEQQRCPRHAMISQLFDAQEDGKPAFDREAIRNEAMILFMAGHETTANTLAWVFYLLSQAEWARDKLDEEHRQVLGGRAPTYEDLGKLVYTRAVIEETLRLYPPVPLLGREAVCPGKLGDREVSEGSIVLVAPWLLHRNPNLWDRPDDFIPERFLGEKRPGKYQYVPFSIGPRVCPGMQFALNEAITCLAVLRQAFDLRLVPGTRVHPSTRLTLRPGETLPMTVHVNANAMAPTPAGEAPVAEAAHT
ncbi:cytochrome P450 [Acuticoccus sp. M5D2P5]|uniref:cytochrome P450 n=1 Tax=Acuticoccus kalidii TaxID=2910977 RepID=UPI001F22195C|nr:cytochrome P450 [Acuticoccus kalidii]MCF3933894.1 cytochrome P450 [Acuticoccus kalidii]